MTKLRTACTDTLITAGKISFR